MAWSYDPTLMLSATAGTYTGSTVGLRNQIRFVIQDTQTARPLLQDAEIDWLQITEGNQFMAAALGCEILVARAGSISSKHVGPLALTYDPKFYAGLAAVLRARGMTYQTPYVGGISIADKLAQEDDPDWVPSRFFRGEFDDPRATNPTAGSATSSTGYDAPGSYP